MGQDGLGWNGSKDQTLTTRSNLNFPFYLPLSALCDLVWLFCHLASCTLRISFLVLPRNLVSVQRNGHLRRED